MRRYPLAARLLAALWVLTLAACGGPGRMLEVSPQQTEVRVTASSFSFDPSHLVARAGETLVLQIHNASGSRHNFTVADPVGKVLRSVELDPRQTVRVEVPLTLPGVYPFHCAKPLHPTLGMSGRIEAR
ncbi:MAG: cupredoxin domain-containing protein [Deferrisomatales bacterium]|nr:cupredoxin domain-containing protein [Deferrisomatales bacterium]